MKHKPDQKYFGWGLTAFLVIAASLLFTYFIFNYSNFISGISRFRKILMPVIDGIALAYLLTPILNLVEKRPINFIYKKLGIESTPKRNRVKRNISIVITLIIVSFILYIFFRIVIPQLILSIQSIIFQFPVYLNNLGNFFTNLLEVNPEWESIFNTLFNTYSEEALKYVQNSVLPQINEIIKTLSSGVISFVKGTFNFIIGIIISVYLMSSKELFSGQAKKIVYALYETKSANKIIAGVRYTHRTFIGFVGGKIIDSIIIGILTFAITSIVHTPYAVLVSVIVGVTNVIPFFGPYIGAIPSALLILMVDPIQALYFVIIILVIQQIDGNIIGPKILGDSTGLSSFWVIFSITLFGGVFGVAGMVIGVPTFAVIYALIKYKINRKLRHKGLPQDTLPYLNVGSIEADGSFIEYVPVKGRSILEILGFKKTTNNRGNIIEDDDTDDYNDEYDNNTINNTVAGNKIEDNQ